MYMVVEKREGRAGPESRCPHLHLVLRQQTGEGLRLIKLNFNQQLIPTSWGSLATGGASSGGRIKKYRASYSAAAAPDLPVVFMHQTPTCLSSTLPYTEPVNLFRSTSSLTLEWPTATVD